jgi:hypothetical protein
MNFKDLFDRAVAANLAYIHWMPANASSGAAMWAQAVAARQLSPRWAEAFLSAADGRRWSIPEAGIALNDSSGFAAHILQTEAGKILCVRGTEFNASLGNVIASLLPGVTLEEQTRKDLLGADWDIAALGIAVEQAVSLANFVRRLQAPLGAEVAQCVVLRPELQRFFLAPDWAAWPLLLLDRPHLFAVSFSTTTATGLGVLAPGEQLEIAGHSLGGRQLSSACSEVSTHSPSMHSQVAPQPPEPPGSGSSQLPLLTVALQPVIAVSTIANPRKLVFMKAA